MRNCQPVADINSALRFNFSGKCFNNKTVNDNNILSAKTNIRLPHAFVCFPACVMETGQFHCL